jgi:hypothetical protein
MRKLIGPAGIEFETLQVPSPPRLSLNTPTDMPACTHRSHQFNFFQSFAPGPATALVKTLLETIKAGRARVILILCHPADMRDIALAAYDLGIKGPGWAFVSMAITPNIYKVLCLSVAFVLSPFVLPLVFLFTHLFRVVLGTL